MATTPTTTTPPSTPIFHVINVDYLNESWCELQYKSGCSSTGSISHINHSVNPEVLEKLLQEAQKEAQSPTTLPKCDLSSSSSLFYSNIYPCTSSSSIINKSITKSTENYLNNEPNKTISSKINKESNLTNANSNNKNKFIKTTVLIDNSNSKSSNLVNLNSNNSIIPICFNSNINVFEIDNFEDDDVDLEYVEDDTCDESNYDTIRPNLLLNENKGCSGAPGPAVSTPCQNCIKHKKQIDLLIEKQIDNQKELIKVKNEFEVKLLNKSLEISCSTPSSSESPCKNFSNKSTVTSGSNTPNKNNLTASNNNDWIKYFSSRPQAHPPKEWKFVHPNSSKSKLDNLRKMDDDLILKECNSKLDHFNYNSLFSSFKILNRDISKLLFTHMASFIVGATL